jgi:hypothetical protein
MWPNIGNLRLSPNFLLKEFFVSSRFPALAEATAKDHVFSDIIKAHYLANTILQPTRNELNQHHQTPKEITLTITSGKCSVELNRKLRPENSDSDHLWMGTAGCVDVEVSSGVTYEAFTWIRDHLPFSFGQLIWYADEHIHVSLPTERHKYEVLSL